MRIRISILRVSLALSGLLGSLASAATLTTLYSFDGTHGRDPQPQGSLLLDGAGNLYGSTYTGGEYNTGTIYRFSTVTNSITDIHTFPKRDFESGNYEGLNPNGGLIADEYGNLYGTTLDGSGGGLGYIYGGTVFSLDRSNNYEITILARFPTGGLESGVSPNSGLSADSNGNLYGTAWGDAGSGGTVFKLDVSNNFSLSTLVWFNGDFGPYSWSLPYGGVTVDANGNVFGIAEKMENGFLGAVYKLDASNDYSFTTPAEFEGSNGSYPNSGFVFDAEGNLYGTTYRGGKNNLGTVFCLDASNDYAITTLAHFSGDDGTGPLGHLFADGAGNLYGVTYGGGEHGLGTVFRLDASNNYALTTIASFDGQSGSYPRAGLVADSYGNLYGVARTGGSNDFGTIFKITDAGFVVPEPTTASMAWVALSLFVVRRHERSRQ